MFQYVSEIVSKFTQKQRILALCLVLLSITLVFLGPDLINKFGGDVNQLNTKLREKDREIDSLNAKILLINHSMVDNEQNCTNRLIQREREIMAQLDTFEKTLKKEKTVLMAPQLSYITNSGESNNISSPPPASQSVELVDHSFVTNGLKDIKQKIQNHINTVSQ